MIRSYTTVIVVLWFTDTGITREGLEKSGFNRNLG